MRRADIFAKVSFSGVVLVVVATAMSYYLEAAESTLTGLWTFCEDAFLPCLLAGLIICYYGFIGLARNSHRTSTFLLAFACFMPAISIALVETMGLDFLNVHGWSMVPFTAAVLFVPLGLVLIVIVSSRP